VSNRNKLGIFFSQQRSFISWTFGLIYRIDLLHDILLQTIRSVNSVQVVRSAVLASLSIAQKHMYFQSLWSFLLLIPVPTTGWEQFEFLTMVYLQTWFHVCKQKNLVEANTQHCIFK